MKRFTVQGLPYRRTLDELGESPLVRCLDRAQARALGEWCATAAVEDELVQGWVDGDRRHHTVAVRRVA